MSEIIEWVLEMQVREGQSDKLRLLLDEMVEATWEHEPGALHYEYYMSSDNMRCTVLERYADNEAVLRHLENFNTHYAERFLTCLTPQRFAVYGSVSDQVSKALDGLGATYHRKLAGFHR